ncbi:MAG: mannosyltransferase B-like protein [Microgenomates group bacterium GW2011_GWA1_48_10]|nr:MAG: mannosyltransferase B-like protein [Microgenomates group bacterium GW2011_GWA1_48_10]
MRLGFVRPPNAGNLIRGVGTYADHLYIALQNAGVGVHWLSPTYPVLNASNFDLIHYPYFDLFFLTQPITLGKSVITVHDLTPLVLPKYFPAGPRGHLKWQVQKNILRTSSAVITVSQASKKDIVNITGLKPEKIIVTYEAAGESFRKLTSLAQLKTVKNKLALPEKFLLYVGDVNANKNIPMLLEAFAQFKKTSLGGTFSLVLAGGAFFKKDLLETENIRRLIEELKIKNAVILPGFVETSDLVGLYNLASAYIQPSLYEGFGLPVLEAMACGTPVICGRNSSLPEVAGDAAIYTDVTNVAEFAHTITSVVSSPRDKYTPKCLAQAAKFSWDKTAKETIAVYEKVLKNK